MAKHTYTVASDTAAERYGVEVGDTVELDLTADEKRAVVAAGWVEPNDEPDTDTKASDTKKGGKN